MNGLRLHLRLYGALAIARRHPLLFRRLLGQPAPRRFPGLPVPR